jgi:NhaP-type Na+/H+ or K+/H+ antiporter
VSVATYDVVVLVDVGPAGTADDEVRFALSSEAGLNDGLALPFVNLAIVLAATGLALDGLGAWFAVDVLWKIGAGTAVGVGLVGSSHGWCCASRTPITCSMDSSRSR